MMDSSLKSESNTTAIAIAKRGSGAITKKRDEVNEPNVMDLPFTSPNRHGRMSRSDKILQMHTQKWLPDPMQEDDDNRLADNAPDY